MILSRYITKISALPVALAASALLWGCAAEEADSPRVPSQEADTQLVLRLTMPQTGNEVTRSTDRTPANVELNVSALRILIFPNDADADPECVVNSPLMLPDKMHVAGAQGDPSDVITYTFGGFSEGSYKIYVIGNIPHDDLRGIVKLSELQGVMLRYSSQLPVAGNLPMIYEEEKDATFTIAPNPTAPAEATLSLKFACVKMSLNILFDKDYTPAGSTDNVGTLYGDNGFKPTAVTLSNVTESVPLLILGQKGKVEGAQTLGLLSSGAFHTDWTETPANADKDADIITPGPKEGADFGAYADSWLWHHTIYLPERYTSTDGQLTLQLEGKLTAADGTETTASVLFEPVKIGVADPDEGVAATDLPRGSYYEVVGHIASKKLDAGQLEIYVKGGEWTVERDTFEF